MKKYPNHIKKIIENLEKIEKTPGGKQKIGKLLGADYYYTGNKKRKVYINKKQDVKIWKVLN